MAGPDVLTPGDTADTGKSKFRKAAKKRRHAKPNAKAPLGQGGRFAALQQQLAAQGASNPGGLAAAIGRKKLGKSRFQKLASKGR